VAGNPRIDELRKKLDKEPGSRLFAQLAEELRKDGDLEDAIQVAREGLQKHSNYPSARMTLGRALFDTGDWAAARSEFELVLKGAPDNILASRLLAESLENLGDAPAAIARYKKTLALAPGDKQVLARMEALETGGGAAGPAAAAGTRAAVAGAPVAPPPIRVVEVDTPMELEQAHERVTAFSASAAPEGNAVAAPVQAPPSPSPAPSGPAPIPVSTAEEDFELERPYEAPRPPASAPPVPPAPERPAPSPPPRQAESMMEFEFEAGPTGSTIPFAPPPAPAPAAEVAAPVPVMAAPPPMPEPVPPPVTPEPVAVAPDLVAAAPEPVAAAPEPVAAAPEPHAAPSPPPAVFVATPEPPPEPPAAAAKTVEVPWSAPPPRRVAAPPAPALPAPPAPAPEPERAQAPAPAPDSASGELTSATLAELYFKQGFPEKAIEVYRQLVAREPDNDRLRRRIAELEASLAPAPVAAVAAPTGPSSHPEPASRRVALERTIAKLEGMLAAIKKG